MTRQLLTLAEAADAAHVHPAVIRALLNSRRLRVLRVWRGARIDRDDLLRAVGELRGASEAQGDAK